MSELPTYYRATVPDSLVQRASLRGDVHASVCVIGAGFAGLNIALGLQQRGLSDVVVLEKNEIGSGASGRNGGFVFGGFSLGDESLIRQQGMALARELYGLTTASVRRIRERILARGIDCDMVDAGVIWANWFTDDSVLHDRAAVMKSLGINWEYWSATETSKHVRSDRYGASLFERDAFHFHPLKYAAHLGALIEEQGGQVFTDSPAVRIERAVSGWIVETEQGRVHCEDLVLSCGGYLAGLDATVDAAVMPIATYVMVTEPLGEALNAVLPSRAAVYDTRFAFDYYRRLVDDRLLWGGRISIKGRSPSQVSDLLRKDLRKVFPSLADARVDYAWNGWMSYAAHQMPQMKQLRDGLWVAQAFGGHGVATTHAAGELLAEAIVRTRRGVAMSDDWNALQRYGLSSTHKPFGFIAAQLEYWRAEFMDAIRR